ncbi:SPOR domain-containing protein [bacterium]|nr:SPOR domain-containing protein [bacterium]
MKREWRDIERNLKALTMIAALASIVLAQGCAQLKMLKSMKGKTKAESGPLVSQDKGSAMDSLARAAVPVDTLVLGLSKAKSQTADGKYYNLRDEAAVEEKSLPAVTGFRVQIASSENRKELDRLVTRVEREFETKSHIDQFGGRWCLRIGDCRKRDAAELLRERAVEFGFKYAWVVQVDLPPGLE